MSGGVVIGEDMVVVEASEFLMGTTNAEVERVLAMDVKRCWIERAWITLAWMGNEKLQHTVYLDAYAIGVHPVTVAQYREFCEATKRNMPRALSWGWLDDHPIVNVTWHEATAYCEWSRKRLPTEAEWEKAARGTDGRIFPWGNRWKGRAAHCDYKHECEWSGKTAPVGSHPEGVSPWGCHDMIGNVWEWCADWYQGGYYRNSPQQNPKGPHSGTIRVLRGGTWRYGDLNDLRCAYRNRNYPDGASDFWGFRCAQDLAISGASARPSPEGSISP